jgi:hypothetical protein
MADSASGKIWTPEQNKIIVEDYFDMLAMEIEGQTFNKAAHNRQLQQQIGKSRGSIEYKHQNISAVLYKLGMQFINGYKPMFNIQNSLIEVIDEYLSVNDELFAQAGPVTSGFREDDDINLHDPPSPSEQSYDDNIDKGFVRLARKFDPAKRDEKNRELGKLGEQIVFLHERKRLIAQDRKDLASKVRWVAQEDGDGLGYDIESFDISGEKRFLEVKTTCGHKKTPFFISENERSFSEEEPDRFRLSRVFDFNRTPGVFRLKPPLDKHLTLSPVSYKATF